jgi:2-C-methyl-D-erythritol 4-phosphate cytidylyltransferase
VPAAGIGSRFGAQQPKQYASIANKPIIHHAIEACVTGGQCLSVTVALAAADQYWQSPNVDAPLNTVTGGAERADSVFAALQSLRSRGVSDDALVLVHDAARPYLPKQDVAALLENVPDDGAAILATPVADTIKQVSADSRVEKTVDRSQLWRALTPQAAPLGVLLDALEHCRQQSVVVTDEASAVEARGLEVVIVQGSAANIKVTLPEDLVAVAAYMGRI